VRKGDAFSDKVFYTHTHREREREREREKKKKKKKILSYINIHTQTLSGSDRGMRDAE
jgi:hypothetical protein